MNKISCDRCKKEIDINNFITKYLKFPTLLAFKHNSNDFLLCDNCYKNFERFMKV